MGDFKVNFTFLELNQFFYSNSVLNLYETARCLNVVFALGVIMLQSVNIKK